MNVTSAPGTASCRFQCQIPQGLVMFSQPWPILSLSQLRSPASIGSPQAFVPITLAFVYVHPYTRLFV